MSDTEFNNYMKKFRDIVKVEDDGCGVWMARGFYGLIYPDVLSKKLLCVTGTNMATSKKTAFINRMKNMTRKLTIYDDGFKIAFDERHLKEIAKIVQCRLKRQYSDDEREKMKKIAKERFGHG